MIWNLFKRKQEKELTPLERKLQAEAQGLEDILKEQGYEEVRYSIFGKYYIQEHEIRIDFDEERNQYRVMNTHERGSSIGRIDYFDNFEEAKKEFLKRIRTLVIANRMSVLDGKYVEYYCPVWNEWEGTEDDLMTSEERAEWERGYEDFKHRLAKSRKKRLKKRKDELLSKIDELGYSNNECYIFENEVYPDSIQLTYHTGTPYNYEVSTIDSNKQVIGEVGKHEEFEDAEKDFLERLKEKYEGQ